MLRTKYKNSSFVRGEFLDLVVSDAVVQALPGEGAAGPSATHWSAVTQPLDHGHNVVTDETFQMFLPVDAEVPVSPVWVRDLAGRVIHTGLGPESKPVGEWAAYFDAGAEEPVAEAISRNVPAVVFPEGAVAASAEDVAVVEATFKTKFRTLEASPDFAAMPQPDNEDVPAMAGIYAAPNLYPYKLRLDTFYADGWRLPQVQVLYARPVTDAEGAERGGRALLAGWDQRPKGEDYPAFLERMGGQGWMERLFERGCTVIPTFEACNGFAVIGRDFTVRDYWPGRAVPGLHQVVEVRDDTAPAETILEVVRPGYVTATGIVPAEVIISSGSGYVSANGDDPLPLLPNLDLPHPRVGNEWGATWVPTHPAHFEPPALWGWDILTGRFMQLAGPLWDPLHYYYASVDEVVRAFEAASGGETGRWVGVPEAMQARVYPVVGMPGFDTLSMPLLQARADRGGLPLSAVKQVRDGIARAGIGYHPLPLEFEYELEPFWMPDLHPANRDPGECPELLKDRICPVVMPTLDGDTYVASVETGSDAGDRLWLKDEAPVVVPSAEVLTNYPHLMRYMVHDLPPEEVLRLAPLPVVGRPDPEWLKKTAQELWPDKDTFEDVEPVARGLHAAIWQQREAGLEFLRLRHAVYGNYPMLYLFAWWYGMGPEALADLLMQARNGGGGAVVADVARARPAMAPAVPGEEETAA